MEWKSDGSRDMPTPSFTLQLPAIVGRHGSNIDEDDPRIV
jgi:hypothetical protein